LSPSKPPKPNKSAFRSASDYALEYCAKHAAPAQFNVVQGKQTVRITGGAFRSRRLHFSAMPGLRPTPDRVRETLFNWLGQNLTGLRGVDLFAGSGILGIEALSRGASMLWAIEKSPRAAARIVQNFSLLGVDATRARVWPADALTWLRQAPGLLAAQPSIDLVFLDPPFAEPGLLNQALLMLNEAKWLAADARIYVECSARGAPIDFPGWVLLREGRAGESRFMLWCRADDVADNSAEPCA
jgi:16S rRNA (guanine966-N2)-methyltransferase